MLFAPKNFVIYNQARLDLNGMEFSNEWCNYERKMEDWALKVNQ